MRQSIRLLRRGQVVELVPAAPTATLLDHLRNDEFLHAAKEACQDAACGACTVVVGRIDRDGRLRRSAVNACALTLAQADGWEVFTLEDLRDGPEGLHPMQQALAEANAAPCGFCTPGMVMSLFALSEQAKEHGHVAVENAIAGNLCRCSGYRPIVDAGVAALEKGRPNRLRRQDAAVESQLSGIADHPEPIFIDGEAGAIIAPTLIEDVFKALAERPAARIVAGGTALHLERESEGDRILLGHVPRLRRIEDSDERLTVGAAVTLDEFADAIAGFDPDFKSVVRSIGSPQIRSVATVGGNVLAPAPWGDIAALLIAVGGAVTLATKDASRTLEVEELFDRSGRPVLEPGELLTEVVVPKVRAGADFRAFRVARRESMAAGVIVAAFLFVVTDGRIASCRVAFGGLDSAARRSPAVEEALKGGEPLDRTIWARAFTALRADFKPPSDVRAGPKYRLETAQALLGKALIEVGSGSDRRTRLRGFRTEAADGSA
ncbi:MAG: FAD binding domain-containing protein [Bauldia sp.]